jgi:hypothetical protein
MLLLLLDAAQRNGIDVRADTRVETHRPILDGECNTPMSILDFQLIAHDGKKQFLPIWVVVGGAKTSVEYYIKWKAGIV